LPPLTHCRTHLEILEKETYIQTLEQNIATVANLSEESEAPDPDAGYTHTGTPGSLEGSPSFCPKPVPPDFCPVLIPTERVTAHTKRLRPGTA